MATSAAVDIGSNSVRLLVRGEGVEVHDLRTTRLARGLSESGRLSPGSIDATLDALRRYRQMIESQGATEVRAVATSATRGASNATEFLEAARQALGVEVEVIDGLVEGNLTYVGAIAHRRIARYVVVDIGGGSTEIMRGEQQLHAVQSFDVGCVRWADRYFDRAGPAVDAARSAAREMFASLEPVSADTIVLGVAGTVSALAAIERTIIRYEPGCVDGHVITRRSVDAWFDRLLFMDVAELSQVPGMPPRREPVIVSGLLILQSLMAALEIDELVVSETDILDGLLASMEGENAGPIGL